MYYNILLLFLPQRRTRNMHCVYILIENLLHGFQIYKIVTKWTIIEGIGDTKTVISSISILSVHDEGYFRDTSCTLHFISTFVLLSLG